MKQKVLILALLLALGVTAFAEDGYGPLITNGLNEQLAIGADLFFNETFEGNGRTCSTCHAVGDNYVLPSDLGGVAEADPLMVADPQNPNFVSELELCSTSDPSENCQAIRDARLILVNADGTNSGPLGGTSYSMRAVPHVLSLSTSITPPAGIDQVHATGVEWGWLAG